MENITSAPLFVLMGSQYGASHVAGNYRLFSGGSPCVNAGTSQYVTVAFDLDGLARKKYGIVDMGAFEYVAPGGTVFIAH